eukprot:TRINITY_DN182_c0_g1_i3.p1 TRINITY_DN182_c0_g1~~TRINITY_DN182_c0_g1_i3.p1  ORF type:complete len:166 (-),score=23.85 TRINITY_DN182_c0_g1_i3:1036-1533(-)
MVLAISDDLKHALQTSIIVSTIILLKFIVTAIIQGGKSGKAGLRAPEDSGNFEGKAQRFNVSGKPEDTGDVELILESARWKQIVLNDLENLPLALVIIWAAILCQLVSGHGSAIVHMVAVIVWGIARLAHTFFYAAAISMPRSLSFMLGLVCVITIAVNGIVAAF